MKKSMDRSSMQIITTKVLPPLKNSENQIQAKFNCNLCGKLALSHLFCLKCKFIFCLECISNTQVRKGCPNCYNQFSLIHREENNIISKKSPLKKCKFFKEGCSATLVTAVIKFHESNCVYQPYICPNKSCTVLNLKQMDAESHHLDCEFSYEICKSCHKQIKLKEFKNHVLSCTSRFQVNNTSSLKLLMLQQFKLPKIDSCYKCRKQKNLADLKKCKDCQTYLCPSCCEDCPICKKNLSYTFRPNISFDSKSIPKLKIQFINTSSKNIASRSNKLNSNLIESISSFNKNKHSTFELEQKSIILKRGSLGTTENYIHEKVSSQILLFFQNSQNLDPNFEKINEEMLNKINFILSLKSSFRNLISEKLSSENIEINSSILIELVELSGKNKSQNLLDFYSLNIDQTGALSLSRYLIKNMSVTSLNLENNSVNQKGFKSISNAIEVNNSLRKINFKSNNLGKLEIELLSEAFKLKRNIEFLNFSCNPLKDEGIIKFCGIIQEISNLKEIILSNCELTAMGASSIGEMLKSTSLRSLNLNQNFIGPEGAMKLSEALEINNSLIKLQLNSNKLTYEGVNYITKALTKNSILLTLDLSNNEIIYEGEDELSSSLLSNYSLNVLDLSYIQIADKGLEKFFNIIKLSKNIKEIALNNIQIKSGDFKYLYEAISNNLYLNLIYLYGNQLNEESVKLFSDSLLAQLENMKKKGDEENNNEENSNVGNHNEENDNEENNNEENNNEEKSNGENDNEEKKETMSEHQNLTDKNFIRRKGITLIEFEPEFKEILYKYFKRKEEKLEVPQMLGTANILADIIRSNKDGNILDGRYFFLQSKDYEKKERANLNQFDFYTSITTTDSNYNFESGRNTFSEMNKLFFDTILKEKEYSTIKISDIPIGDKSLKYLLQNISISSNIEKLYLCNCQMNEESGLLLANLFKNSQKLHILWVNKNNLGIKGTKYLSEALKINKSIEDFQISSNKIGNEGTKFIECSLHFNSTLKYLSIADNQINKTGVESIIGILNDNETLANLDISSNNIGNEGIKGIFECLYNNKSLTTISFCKCNISNQGVLEIKNFLNPNSGSMLKKMYAYDNYITKQVGDNLFLNFEQINSSNEQKGNFIELINAIDFGGSAQSAYESHLKVRSLNNRIENDPSQRNSMNIMDLPKEITNLSNEKILNLQRRKLGIESSKIISKLFETRTIRFLDLRDNDLCKDSSFLLIKLFSKNKDLECVNFSSNRSLSDEGTLNILEGIKLCKTIKSLNLSNCQIGPNGAFCLSILLRDYSSIIYLNLNYNFIQELGSKYLAESLEKTLFLEEIYLNSNHIGTSGAELFKEGLIINKSLKSVGLGSNNIKSEGVTALLYALCQNQFLTNLDLTNSDIEGKTIESMDDFLSSNDTLKFLSLANNELGSMNISSFCKGLPKNKGLENIIISKTKFDETSIRLVVKALMETYRQRKGKININNFIQVEKDISSQIMDSILSSGGTKTILQFNESEYFKNDVQNNLKNMKINGQALNLNFRCLWIGNKGVEFISNQIKTMDNILELDLRMNNITNKGLPSINIIVHKLRYLRKLNLSSNPIEDIGIELLQKESNQFVPLKKLLMNNCNLTSQSIIRSSSSIFQSTFLKTLSFENNNIQATGIKELLRKMNNSKSISILFLEANNLKDSGAKECASFVQRDNKLRKLNVSNNEITKKGMEDFNIALSKNRSLKYFSVAGNNIGDSGIANLNLNHYFHLRELVLNYCHLTNESVNYLKEYVEGNLYINSISLFGNFFNEIGAELLGIGYSIWYKRNEIKIKEKTILPNLFLIEQYLLNIIYSKNTNLTNLKEEWNEESNSTRFLQSEIENLKNDLSSYKSLIFNKITFNEKDFNLLCSTIANIELDECIFEKNNLVDSKMSNLIHSLLIKGNNHLTKISFSRNQISNDQLVELLKHLPSCSHFSELYLSDCNLSMDAGIHLRKFITNSDSLRILDLGKNQLQNHGIKIVCKSLYKNNSIIEINLGSNSIDDKISPKIKKVLTSNTCIKKLIISDNKFSFEGAKIIAKGLNLNGQLEEFDFSNNPIKDLGAKYLSDEIFGCNNLKVINLSNCKIGITGVLDLLNYLSENSCLNKLLLIGNTLEERDILEINSCIQMKLKSKNGNYIIKEIIEFDEKVMKELNFE